jgi:hypothetical protein
MNFSASWIQRPSQKILPTQRITRDKKPPQPSGFLSQGELF